MGLDDMIPKFTKWLNDNQGVLSLVLFIATILTGWISGIFRSLIRKPKFSIRVIEKMTFGVVYTNGDTYTPPGHGTYTTHKTAIAIYMEIVNIGSAPSNLGKIQIGYYKDDGKNTLFQRRVWIKESNILGDFTVPTGDGQAILLPHLRQSSLDFGQKYDGFLEVGKSIIGVNYFEQPYSWGNAYPRIDSNNMTNVLIEVKDAFGNVYKKKADVPIIDFQIALNYNPKFGYTEQFYDSYSVDIQANDKEDQGGEQE